MNYYNRFIGAIQRKTSHLSMAAMGAYDRLLDWHYANERPIPIAPEEGWRICGAVTAAEQAIVSEVLPAFFDRTADGWVQARAAEEIPKARKRIDAARTNGAKGGRPRKNREETQRVPETKPAGQPSPKAPHTTVSSSPPSKKISKASPSHPPDGGLPRGFAEFWQAWPKGERKQDKAKCAELWKARGLLKVADEILADVRAKRGTTKWAEGFIEAPLVYLRNRRWEDGNTEAADEQLGDWRTTKAGVERMAKSLGMPPWDQAAFEAATNAQEQRDRSFQAYEARVAKAREEREGQPA